MRALRGKRPSSARSRARAAVYGRGHGTAADWIGLHQPLLRPSSLSKSFQRIQLFVRRQGSSATWCVPKKGPSDVYVLPPS